MISNMSRPNHSLMMQLSNFPKICSTSTKNKKVIAGQFWLCNTLLFLSTASGEQSVEARVRGGFTSCRGAIFRCRLCYIHSWRRRCHSLWRRNIGGNVLTHMFGLRGEVKWRVERPFSAASTHPAAANGWPVCVGWFADRLPSAASSPTIPKIFHTLKGQSQGHNAIF